VKCCKTIWGLCGSHVSNGHQNNVAANQITRHAAGSPGVAKWLGEWPKER